MLMKSKTVSPAGIDANFLCGTSAYSIYGKKALARFRKDVMNNRVCHQFAGL
jgi:hypothetical protein